MEITKTAGVSERPELAALADARAGLVKEAFAGNGLRAAWELATDWRGKRVLRLRVADGELGQGSLDLDPAEPPHEAELRHQLAGLKGSVAHVGRFRERLAALYGDMRYWLRKLDGVEVAELPLVLNQEPSGEYEVTRLLIAGGERQMVAEPVAAWVVGGEGRVDLWGLDGPFVLIYGSERGWYQEEEYPSKRRPPLTEELFLGLARACLDA